MGKHTRNFTLITFWFEHSFAAVLAAESERQRYGRAQRGTQKSEAKRSEKAIARSTRTARTQRRARAHHSHQRATNCWRNAMRLLAVETGTQHTTHTEANTLTRTCSRIRDAEMCHTRKRTVCTYLLCTCVLLLGKQKYLCSSSNSGSGGGSGSDSQQKGTRKI